MLTYKDFFPEIKTPPFCESLTLHTLTTLKIRSAALALKKGHFCLLNSYKYYSRTVAGIWIHQDDLTLAEQVAQKIAATRTEKVLVKRKSERQKANEVIQAHRTRIVRDLTLYASKPLSQDILTLIDQQLLCYKGQSTERLFTKITDRYLSQHPNPQRPLLLFGMDSFVIAKISINFKESVFIINQPVPLKLIWLSIFSQNNLVLTKYLTKKTSDIEKNIHKRLIDQSLPQWIPEDILVKKIVNYALKMKDLSSVSIVKDCLADLTSLLGEEGIICYPKTKKWNYRVTVNILMLSRSIDLTQAFLLENEFTALLSRHPEATTLKHALILSKQDIQLETELFLQKLWESLLASCIVPNNLYIPIEDQSKLLSDSFFKILLRHSEFNFGKNYFSQINKEFLLQFNQVLSGVLALQCKKQLPKTLPEFYPLARQMTRKLILVVGTTNSGKTYQALEKMKRSLSGVYLAPLRLLAMEVRDLLEDAQVPTTLMTGDLIIENPEARHIASTIEMLDFDTPVDVAIIDEVQMLGDRDRGTAWLQAILGVPAKEVWLLGAPEAKDALLALASMLNEPIEIIETQRLSPFVINDHPTKLHHLPKKSAIIAFSRREVLAIAGELQRHHQQPVSVIYGALSPEVRREQARRFRDGETDYVVATDAIGMGLNLPIQSLFFTSHVKWNGVYEGCLEPDLVWQIAGRAGRFGLHETGFVGATNSSTLNHLKKALKNRPSLVPSRFQYGASWPIIQVISRYLGTEDLSLILGFFKNHLKIESDPRFLPFFNEDQLILSEVIRPLNLSLKIRFLLINAPVPMQKHIPIEEFYAFALAVEKKTPILISKSQFLRANFHSYNHEIAELGIKKITLYTWFHYRLPEIFPDLDLARSEIEKLNQVVLDYLSETVPKTCQRCEKKMKWDYPHSICERCYQQRNYSDRDNYF